MQGDKKQNKKSEPDQVDSPKNLPKKQKKQDVKQQKQIKKQNRKEDDDNDDDNKGDKSRVNDNIDGEQGGEQGEQNSNHKKQQEQQQQKMQMSKISQGRTLTKQQLWKPYDFLFPGGKLAKLIKVNNIYKKNLPIQDMLDKFKYVEHTPVINIIGAMEKGRGKFYAGIARAAFNTDAVIVDNGLASGLQKFSLRRGVKLIGIAPEGQIKFPRINPSQVEPNQLANGHTHLFLVNNPSKDLRWGGQVSFKVDLCIKIAEGKNRPKGLNRCKIVSIIMGDATFDVTDQVKLCIENQIPLIVVPGSSICDQLIKCSQGQGRNSQLSELVKQGHLFYCNSTNSQDIAQLTHLLLSITPW